MKTFTSFVFATAFGVVGQVLKLMRSVCVVDVPLVASALLAAAQPCEVGAAPSFKQQVLPVGSRVVLDLPPETDLLPVEEMRALVASVVSMARSVKFQLRPLASALQPPLSKEAMALVSSCGISLRERAEHAGMTVEEAFDELLLHLWDARKRG